MTTPAFTQPEPGVPADASPGVVPVAPIVVARPKGSGRTGNALLALAAAVAVGGLAFAGGRLTAPAGSMGAFPGAATGVTGTTGTTGSTGAMPAAPGASAMPGAGGGPMGSMTLSGTVASTDGSTMTLTTSDGSSVTIDLSGTAYHAQAAASSSDIATGDAVTVTVSGGFGPGAATTADGTTTVTASDVTRTSD